MEIIRNTLGILLGVCISAFCIFVCFFYIRAGIYGADVWFGWSGWWVVVLAVLLTLFFAKSGPNGRHDRWRLWGLLWVAVGLVAGRYRLLPRPCPYVRLGDIRRDWWRGWLPL